MSAPEVFLGAASQRTTRIRLGHGIMQLPTSHPIRVAERVAVLALGIPRPRDLVLVEDSELHRGPVTSSVRTIAARPPSSFRMIPERGSTVRFLPWYSTSSPFSFVT